MACKSLKARKLSSLKCPYRTLKLMLQSKKKIKPRKRIKIHQRRKLQNLPRKLQFRKKSNLARQKMRKLKLLQQRMRKLLQQWKVRSVSNRAKQSPRRLLLRPKVARMIKLLNQHLRQTKPNEG